MKKNVIIILLAMLGFGGFVLSAPPTIFQPNMTIGNATTTNATTTGSQVFSYITGSTQGLQVDTNGLVSGLGYVPGATGQSGAWQEIWSNTLAPTSTSAGIFVYSSSTIHNNFRVDGNSTTTGSMYIANDLTVLNGRVGIGTASPSSAFQIKASVSGLFGQIIIQNPADDVTSNVAITAYESDGSGNPDQQLWYLGNSSSGNEDITFLNRRNAKLQLGTNGVAKMTILGDGNIGIGTTTPAVKLVVSEAQTSGATPVFQVQNTHTGNTLNTFELLTPYMPDGGYMYFAMGKEASNNNRAAIVYEHVVDGSTSNYMSFGFYGAGELFNVLASGNVGIGTTTPASLLTVDGTFAVGTNGTEFIVDAGGNATTTGAFSIDKLSVGNNYWFPETAGTNNQILKTDASGILTWQADADSGGAGAAAWEQLWVTAISPTTTNAGIYVTGSSTIDSNFRITGITTTTDSMFIDGSRDATQLTIQGNGTQTEDIFVVEKSDGTDYLHVEEDGGLHIFHTSTMNDDHALEIDIDAANFGGVHALDIVYDTGNISAGEEESGILINIDRFSSGGGSIKAIDILATEGTATAYGIEFGVGVNPIEHKSGTFGNMSNATSTVGGCIGGQDCRAEFIDTGTDITIFSADNSEIIIGNTATFSEIEVLLATESSKTITPTFQFSTGLNAWTTFAPIDGTNGFQNNGVIDWDLTDIPTWDTGTSSLYMIRITRTRNNLVTDPIEDKIQISSVTNYYWNDSGNIKVQNATTTGWLNIGTTVPTNELSAGDLFVGNNATTTKTFEIGSGGELVVDGERFGNLVAATTTLDYWFANTAGIDTDGLSEGSSNFYYTQAQWDADFIATSTWAGFDNLFDTRLNASTTRPTDADVTADIATHASDDDAHHALVTITGEDYASLSTQQITFSNIDAANTDLTDAYSWTGAHDFDTQAIFTGGIRSNEVMATSTLDDHATTTGSLHLTYETGSTQCLQVDTNGLVSGTGSACGAGGGEAAWEFDALADAMVTTSTKGIMLVASSSIGADFRIDGSATTTGSQYIKGDLEVDGTASSTRFLAVSGAAGTPSYSFNEDTDTGLFARNGGLALTAGGSEGFYLQSDEIYLSDSEINAGSGSAASPPYSFNQDFNTGIYRIADEIIGFTTGGVERLRIDGGGLTIAGNSTTTNATTTGSMYIAGDLNVVGDYGLVAGDIPDISATYSVIAGNAAIVTVGAIGTGTWESDVIAATYGGTGVVDPTDHTLLIGSGSGAMTPTAVGTDGQLLVGDSANDPVWATLTAGDDLSLTAGAGTIELDVDDSFLQNDVADTGVGITLTYSTSTASMIVPQGAAPDIDVVGEIGIDTTSDTFRFFGASERVLDYQEDISFSIASTTFRNYLKIPIKAHKKAITITDIHCFVITATDQDIFISDGTNDTETIACDVDGQEDDGSIANGTFTAREFMYVEMGTPAGDPDWLNVTITYTLDSD